MQLRGSQLERGFVIGGYRIDELISRGGMGVVYRATNVALNRIYALKVLAPELAGDQSFRERFKREMRIASSINHPNVVSIHYAGEQEGFLFFVMDFIYGTDLRELLRRSGAIEPERAVDLLAQFASALDAAHARGLVHRDVKPANILITVRDGEEHAYLTDFGVAKRFDSAAGLTAHGAVVGTVDYMSPEQITGGHTDARTDVYALGCVFFQMISGKVPYERENSVAKLFAHVHEHPPPLEEPLDDLYPTFGPVLEKAMAKEPADRYVSAGDFARDAAAALHGSRFTGPATVVGVGDASPTDPGPPQERQASLSLDAPDTDVDRTLGAGSYVIEPVALSASSEASMSAERGAARESAPSEPAPSESAPSEPAPSESAPRESAPREPAPSESAPRESAPRESAPRESAPRESAPREVAPQADRGSAVKAPKAADGSRARYGWAALALLVVIGAVVGVVVALSSGGSSTGTSAPTFAAAARPVPTNRVTGSGSATVAIQGNTVTVTLDTNGLLNGSPHAMHIHAGGQGICPPASAARLHNGNLSISTTDGIKFYGHPQASLTLRGDTSRKSIIDFSRYPTTRNIRYKRTFQVPTGVADAIRASNAVIVVHGIDYNRNGIYDNVLDRSELSSALPGEATAPALCGRLLGTSRAAVGRSLSRSSDVVYAVALHTYHPPPGDASSSLVLLCHLAGVPVPSQPGPDLTIGSTA